MPLAPASVPSDPVAGAQSAAPAAVAKPSAKLYVAPKTAVTVTAQPASKPILVPSTAPSVVPKVVEPLVTLVTSKPLAQELPLPASDQQVVEQLLTEADQLKAQGKVTQAVIQLQRAQRIAPREPKVYARLAALQLSLGEASRAEQLALKGLTLVPNKSSYQYYFWKLIGASRSHLGDSAGETKAIAEAAKYK
jgi:tetratricopeptide (TPR) repeat protein